MDTHLENVLRWVGAAGACLAGVWVGLDMMFRLLLVFIVIDILSGLLAAYVTATLSSDVSARGMARKAGQLLLVAMGELLELAPVSLAPGAEPINVPIGQAVAGFFLVHEGISILENLGTAGVPIPEILRQALAKVPGNESAPADGTKEARNA